MFGVNLERCSGGEDAPGSADRAAPRVRRCATTIRWSAPRFRDRGAHACRTRSRPRVDDPGRDAVPPGVVRLLVMRARAPGGEPATALETPRWLEAVRRTLAPRR